jgi:hypothetical protein
VRLNGMDVGKSPLLLNEVRSGNARVQLECDAGAIGRIHNLELRPGDNELSIDPLFDAAVHSQAGLWLGYPNEREREARAASDAQTIGAALGVQVVMLWNVPGALGPDIALRVLSQGQNRELARAGFAAGSGYAPGGPSKLISALLGWSRAGPPRPARSSRPQPLPLPRQATSCLCRHQPQAHPRRHRHPRPPATRNNTPPPARSWRSSAALAARSAGRSTPNASRSAP